jgi:hypothetical protein
MLLKSVTWDLRDSTGYHADVITNKLEKTASFQGKYSDEIVKAVERLVKKPGHTYLLINAMGAGEFYGPNKNNDYFPEKVLRDYHKTFEALAYAYKHHVNKDPQRSYGKVVYSFYNDKMHRVELIVEINNEKAHDIIDRISKNDHVAVSMGCKVPYDECSECGNRAKTREEYCAHLKRGTAGIVQANGRRPYAINWQPKFFDISFVTIPADPTASVMAKLASMHMPSKSSLDDMDEILKAAKVKHADLAKVIDGEIVAASEDPQGLIPFIQDDMPLDEIKALVAKHRLNEILSTLLAMRIMPKRRDFQRLVLHATGHEQLSDELDECGELFPVDPSVNPIVPADVDINYMNERLAQSLAHWIPQRSLTKPLIIIRMAEKLAEMPGAPGGGYVNGNAVPMQRNRYRKPRYIVTVDDEGNKIFKKLAEHTKLAKDPDPASYKGQKGDVIAKDLVQTHGMTAETIHPWMYKNNLWDKDASNYYVSQGWSTPLSNPDAIKNAPTEYDKAVSAYNQKHLTSADALKTLLTQYSLWNTELGKEYHSYLNPVAQNAKTPYGLKGYRAFKQTSLSPQKKEMLKARISEALMSEEGPERRGLPTALEEDGLAIPKANRALSKLGEEQQQSPQRPGTKSSKNPFFAITGLGALYIGFQRLMNMGVSKDLPKMERTFIRNPWMLPLLAGAVGIGTELAQDTLIKQSAYVNPQKYQLSGLKSILAAAVPSYARDQGAARRTNWATPRVRKEASIFNYTSRIRRYTWWTTST